MTDLKFSKVKLTLDGKQVEMSLDQIRKKSEQTAAAMKGMKPDTKEWKEARKVLEALHAAEEDLVPTLERVNHYMQEMAKTATADLGKATRELTKLRDAMPGDHKDLEKVNGFIEVFKDMMKQNRNLGVTISKAKEQLNDLVNTPTEKLRQGLAAINKELDTNAKLSDTDRADLKGYARQYEAQLAVNQYGKAGSSSLVSLNDEQLKAEQSRLRSLYMSTHGAAGFEGVSDDALDRLQKANQLIKDRADAERESARAAKEAEQVEQQRLDFARQGQETHKTLANMEKASYEDLENALKHLEEQRQKYIKSGDTKHIQRNLQLQDSLKKKQEEMQKLMLTDKQISDRVNNSKKYSVQELQQAYDQLKYKLTTLHTGDVEGIMETRSQLKSLEKDIKDVEGEATGLTKIFRTAVRNIATYVGVFAGFNLLKSKIVDIVKDSLQLSDSMAQVQKVTGLVRKEVDALNNSLIKLDTRTSLSELNELAYSAGKMGLGKYGVEGVEGFVKATNQLQVALGEDLGSSVEEAITPLAKLAENMGMIEKMGVEKSMLAIGSSINELSQTTTAVGANIVDFARRIQPTAQMLNLTVDQVLALGSAADSFGLHAEVAATSFTKFLAAYRTNTAAIEEALGITKGTLDELYDQGKTIEGLMLIFQRMHDIGDVRVLAPIFKELGSEGSRMFETFGAFSKNVDQLSVHVKTSSQAFAEATSVTREYNLVQETAQGLVERSSNMWQNAFVNPKGVDNVQKLARAWYDLTNELTHSQTFMKSAEYTLKGIVLLVENLVRFLPAITAFLVAQGILKGLRALKLELILIKRQWNAVKLATEGATVAQRAFNLATKANWAGILLSALAMGIGYLVEWAASANDAAESTEKFTKDLGDAHVQIAIAQSKLEPFRDAINNTAKGTREHTNAINAFNNEFGGYLKNLLTESSTANDVAAAYERVNRALQGKILLEMKNRDMESVYNPSLGREVGLMDKYQQLSAGTRYGMTSAEGLMNFTRESIGKISARDAILEFSRQFEGYFGDKGIYLNTIMQNLSNNDMIERELRNVTSKEFHKFVRGAQYILQSYATESKRQKIEAKYKPYEDDIKLYEETQITPTASTTPPTVPTGGTGGGGTKKVPEWMVEEKKEAEKATKAVIGSIEEFYRLQEAAANELAANGQLKDADLEMLIKHIQDRKDKMLLEARRAIVGDKSTWDEIKKTLDQDLVNRDSEVSLAAIKRIQEAEPGAAGAKLRKYNGSDAVFNLDSNAYLNEIRKNAAQNELNIQRRKAAIAQEIDKILLQYQFVEQSQRDFGDKLVTLGLITDGYQKVVKQLADGTKITANSKEVSDFAAKVVGMGSRLYSVNPENVGELQKLMYDAMTTVGENGLPAMESFVKIFPNFDKWMQQPQQYKEEMQAMYELMLQYEGIYYDKLKQRDDLQNKRLDSWWEHSDEKKKNDKDLRNAKIRDFQFNTMYEGQNMGYMMGLTNDLTQDPEVLREQAILEAKIAIWRKAEEERKAGLISEEVYQQRLRDMQDQTIAYTQTVMQNIQKRIDRLHQFAKPVEQFAGNVGKKLGEMIKNIQDQSMTWNEIFKDMELAVAEAMLNMAAEYAKQVIVQKAMNKERVADEAATATAVTMLGISEASAKTLGTLGWIGIALIPIITSLLMGLLQGALSSANKSSESTSTATPKTKLVSNMLTYDKGNVQRFIGQDGKVYTATEEPQPKDGLITHPIATTVQGQPALVAEKGPEIVIGRETTRAIMMNEPELIRYLANYQQQGGRRLFDDGNLPSSETVTSGSAAGTDAEMRQTMNEMREVMAGVLYYLQNPIPPEIAMYDRGGKKGLHTQIKEADRFMARYGG